MTRALMTANAQNADNIGVWFPTLRAETGADRFTERLVDALNPRGIRAEISWLPHRAEYLPWSIPAPQPPPWANIVHINPWLPHRFIPDTLPCVATLHSCVYDSALHPYKTTLQRIYHRHWTYRRESKGLDRAQHIVAVSHYTAAINRRVFGIEEITTIPNWVDTTTFIPVPERAARHPFRLLFVGNIGPRKGSDLLPKILARLGPDYELHYTGTEHALARYGPLPDNLVALGRLNTTAELVQAYQGADALLFPTRLEGLPLTALEAMACGLPIVATDCSSLPEVVEHGKTGLLCERDNVDAFVAAVRSLKSDREQARAFATRARARAEEAFSEARAIEGYLAIYRRLSGGTGP